MRTCLFIILSLFIGESASAQMYLLGEGGYFNLRQAEAMDDSVTPKGFSYGAGLGLRKQFYELEVSYLKASGEDDIIHDDQKNTMVHEQSTFLLALNFYLTKKLYARLGYGVSKVDQSIKKEISAASAEGAKDSYGLVEDKMTDGPVFGGGYVLYNGKKLSLYTQLEYLNYSSIDSGAWNASIGFRFYLSR